jgi:hypothetical protein
VWCYYCARLNVRMSLRCVNHNHNHNHNHQSSQHLKRYPHLCCCLRGYTIASLQRLSSYPQEMNIVYCGYCWLFLLLLLLHNHRLLRHLFLLCDGDSLVFFPLVSSSPLWMVKKKKGRTKKEEEGCDATKKSSLSSNNSACYICDTVLVLSIGFFLCKELMIER